ncbi:MAG: penicillin-binding protein 2 [bacterium]
MRPRRVIRKQSKSRNPDRITVLVVLLFGFSSLLLIRLFTLQVLAHGFYEILAAGQYEISQKLMPVRGEIFAQDRYSGDQLFPLATNMDTYLAYAIPKRVNDAEKVAEEIAPLLQVDKEIIMPRLSKSEDLYEPLQHDISEETKLAVEGLNFDGIEFARESKRYYPENNIGSHILGFVGNDGNEKVGQYGLEQFYQSELAGEVGFLQAERDAAGRWITVGDKLLEEAKDGDDLILTIDRTVQYTVCSKLSESVQKHGAEDGAAIVMDPNTGAIIAMCGYPDFDPNNYGEVEDLDSFINTAITSYEPGSIFKSITMAAALDTGAITPNTTYVDEGSVQISKYTIKNSDGKAYRQQTMTQVLEKSLNTGAIFAVQQTGNDVFYDYVKKFGFGEATGVELGSESAGNLGELSSGKDIYAATASFGQGITVTPLQMAAAFSAIANGGTLYQPYIVDEIVKPNDFRIKTEPKSHGQVISQNTSTTLSAMLVNVVKNGHGQRAGVPGYYIAGKTGTAQMPSTNGSGYDPNRTIGSFIGFGPVGDPKFVIITKIVDPKDVRFAESTAAPLFGEIAQFLLNYYEIPPTITE